MAHLALRAAAGALLVVSCAALIFSWRPVRDSLEGALPEDLLFIAAPAALRLVFGAGIAGGTWLMATAWIQWRTGGDATPA